MSDLLTNPEYVRHALKTTGAAMFCYALYSLLDWRGIHTCFITCYIVSLGTSAETIEKFVLRIAGCLIGAAAGLAAIVYVIPSLTSIGALLAVVFLVALASAWVAAGSARISYAGFQIAFAFFLCVIQGPSPAFDLTIARDRIVGILLGNLVVYLILHPPMARERGETHRSGDRCGAASLERHGSGDKSDDPALSGAGSARGTREHRAGSRAAAIRAGRDPPGRKLAASTPACGTGDGGAPGAALLSAGLDPPLQGHRPASGANSRSSERAAEHSSA